MLLLKNVVTDSIIKCNYTHIHYLYIYLVHVLLLYGFLSSMICSMSYLVLLCILQFSSYQICLLLLHCLLLFSCIWTYFSFIYFVLFPLFCSIFNPVWNCGVWLNINQGSVSMLFLPLLLKTHFLYRCFCLSDSAGDSILDKVQCSSCVCLCGIIFCQYQDHPDHPPFSAISRWLSILWYDSAPVSVT